MPISIVITDHRRGFPSTFGIKLVAGKGWKRGDQFVYDQNETKIMINESMSRKLALHNRKMPCMKKLHSAWGLTTNTARLSGVERLSPGFAERSV